MTPGGETMSKSIDEATIAKMIARLSAEDASNFPKVLQAYLAANGNASDDEKAELLDMVWRHTADLVRQTIIQAAGPVTIRQLRTDLDLKDPLLAQVVRLCEHERIIEPRDIGTYIHQMLAELVDEFNDFEWWWEAILRAVKSNKRRLSTVERILRDHQETGSWEPPWKQKVLERQRGKASKARRGPQERGVQEIRGTQERRGTLRWDEEEIARRRAQLPPEEWGEPPD